MMNEKCAACIHCEVCGLIESEVAKDGACDFYEDGKRWRPIKTGHWIRWYEQKETDWYIENIPHCKCSECDKEYDPHSSQFIKYCNECGARMFEQQESEGER